jgi:hypothetical protein
LQVVKRNKNGGQALTAAEKKLAFLRGAGYDNLNSFQSA